ncbi:MAG: hypothetical protein QOG91_13 [Candidatus Parcubacteria bacterium]|jgi:hypothetical protein|nr:hypothetical protein [Candidatus Parcubacteria bacterium]
MNPKLFIWLGVAIGGAVGGYVPVLFGASALSFSSVIGSTVGGLAGIWLGFRLSQLI